MGDVHVKLIRAGTLSSTTTDDVHSSDVVAAIGELDGRSEIEVIHSHGPVDTWLSISGGPRWFFVAYAEGRDAPIAQAVAADPVGEPSEFVIGGQPATVTPKYRLSKAIAAEVAAHFCETGKPLATIDWDVP